MSKIERNLNFKLSQVPQIAPLLQILALNRSTVHRSPLFLYSSSFASTDLGSFDCIKDTIRLHSVFSTRACKDLKCYSI